MPNPVEQACAILQQIIDAATNTKELGADLKTYGLEISSLGDAIEAGGEDVRAAGVGAKADLEAAAGQGIVQSYEQLGNGHFASTTATHVTDLRNWAQQGNQKALQVVQTNVNVTAVPNLIDGALTDLEQILNA